MKIERTYLKSDDQRHALVVLKYVPDTSATSNMIVLPLLGDIQIMYPNTEGNLFSIMFEKYPNSKLLSSLASKEAASLAAKQLSFILDEIPGIVFSAKLEKFNTFDKNSPLVFNYSCTGKLHLLGNMDPEFLKAINHFKEDGTIVIKFFNLSMGLSVPLLSHVMETIIDKTRYSTDRRRIKIGVQLTVGPEFSKKVILNPREYIKLANILHPTEIYIGSGSEQIIIAHRSSLLFPAHLKEFAGIDTAIILNLYKIPSDDPNLGDILKNYSNSPLSGLSFFYGIFDFLKFFESSVNKRVTDEPSPLASWWLDISRAIDLSLNKNKKKNKKSITFNKN